MSRSQHYEDSSTLSREVFLVLHLVLSQLLVHFQTFSQPILVDVFLFSGPRALECFESDEFERIFRRDFYLSSSHRANIVDIFASLMSLYRPVYDLRC